MENGNFDFDLYGIELSLIEQSYNPVIITTPLLDGEHPKILYVNSAFLRMTGYGRDEIIGKTPRILQGEKTDKKTLARLKETLKKEEYFEGEAINYKKDGTEYFVHWNISPVYDKSGNLAAFLSFQKDVTVTRTLQRQLLLFRQGIDQSADFVALFDSCGNYIYANKAYLERTGYEAEELIGQNPSILKSGKHDNVYYSNLWSTVLSGKAFSAIFCNKTKNGEFYYEKQTITPIVDEDSIIGFISIGKSYDYEKQFHDELQNESRLDKLTGLLNRKALDEKIDEAIKRFEVYGEPFCLLFADLDNFKNVNDALGHDVGDTVLKEIADSLRLSVRGEDDLFRYGGDEFVCLMHNTTEQKAKEEAKRLRDVILSSKCRSEYGIDLSVGVSEYGGEAVHSLFKAVDKQMYLDKKKHKEDG